MFGTLMLLCDLSRAGVRALEWAAGLAALFGSRLTIVHVIEWSPEKGDAGASEKVELQIRAELSAAVEKTAPELVDEVISRTRIEVLEGRPAVTLLGAIGRDAPDLVVMGTAGLSDLPHVLMGSVAEKVVRHSPSPVLVTRKTSAWPPRSVLLPVDFSGPVDETFALAEALAGTLPVRFSLVHVITPVPPTARVPSLPPGDLMDGLAPREKDALERLEALQASHPKLDTDSFLLEGPAADQICQSARDSKTDLILIPTHSRSGLERFLMGGVAEQVVRYAPCAVLSHCPKAAVPYRSRLIRPEAS
ncbi:MAG TPA: universal stress protein [bacterium]|nr:universal stress protein [bacterium]